MTKQRLLYVVAVLLTFPAAPPAHAMAEASINSECPNEKISEIDHQKWHRSLMSSNGYFTAEQLSRITAEIQNCKASSGWTDEQAQWVQEYIMSSKASSALADKLALLDFDPYSEIDLRSWPMADLESLIQNSQGPQMRRVIDEYAKANDGIIPEAVMPILRDYVAQNATFEIALFKLYGKDLPGSIDISNSD